MTTKLLLKVSLLSLIFCVNGQFKHFPVQAGRPDSPTRQQQAARPRPAPALGNVEDNEVIPAPVARSRGRGRSRGAQRTVQETPQRPQRVQETPQRPQRVQETPQRVQETPQRPQRVQDTPQRPQRVRVPERSREVPQTTNLR